VAYRFLAEGEYEERTLTYAQIDRRAGAVAAALREQVPIGSRVLLCLAPGLDYVCGFFGCLFAGMIAVPTYPPGVGGSVRTAAAFADDSGAALVLTTTDLLPARDRLKSLAPALARLPWLPVNDLEPGDLEPGDLEPGDLEPGDLEPGDLEPGDLEPGDLVQGLSVTALAEQLVDLVADPSDGSDERREPA
jgi:acyl-CoA synthetase (AMP-forming)/AMP-acid ligase II